MNQSYTVKSGDTLYGISNQFGVSVMDLARVNNLSLTDTLSIGKSLTIPTNSGTNPNTMFTYTVQKGDSLYSIAKKYNTTPDIIIRDNSLSSNNLSVGQNLKIRVDKSNEKIEECFGEDYIPPTTEETRIYTVKKGDSLYSIAKNYNTSIDKIKRINNLTSNSLSIGQILKIPTTTSNNTYIVQKGDSLYSIAKKYNTTIDSIKTKNNLTSNLLSIGQELII